MTKSLYSLTCFPNTIRWKKATVKGHSFNFSEHVTKVCNKINSSISVLTRTRKFVNQSTAFLSYNALVLPQIDYCCMVWGAKPTLVTKIQKLQNRALRVVLKLSPLSPTNQIFGTLNTMTVSQRIRFQLGCQAFRAGIGVAPDYLCQKLNRIQPGNRPTTRAVSQGNFVVPKPRCELFKNSFSYRASEFLNSIPLAIRSGPYSSFRRLLKENRIWVERKYFNPLICQFWMPWWFILEGGGGALHVFLHVFSSGFSMFIQNCRDCIIPCPYTYFSLFFIGFRFLFFWFVLCWILM